MTSALLSAAFAAIYGDSVHPGEISKLLDPSAMHINTAGDTDTKKKKGLAGGLLLGSTAEGLATTRAAQKAFPSAGKSAVLKPITRAADALDKLPAPAELGVQAANLAVGLGAAHTLLKKPNQPVNKAARARLTPMNAIEQRHVVSVKAKLPSSKPIPVAKRGNHVLRLVAVPGGVAKREPQVTWTGEICKVDEERQQVFGWCSVSHINGEEVVDRQDDIMPIEEVEKAAYRYVLESRKGGDMHRRVGKSAPLQTATMIESFVVTPEKLEKMGLPENSLPHGWWIGLQVTDPEQWAAVKNKERLGFSVHGTGTRSEAA